MKVSGNLPTMGRGLAPVSRATARLASATEPARRRRAGARGPYHPLQPARQTQVVSLAVLGQDPKLHA